MSNEKPKQLDEITKEDILDEALAYAQQFGLNAERSNCTIEPIPPKPLEQEIGGGGSATRNPINSWTVIIRQKERTGVVTVEYNGFGGCVEAVGFRGW